MSNAACTSVLLPFEIDDISSAQLHDAALRAELRGEADPGLHAAMARQLIDAAAAMDEHAALDARVEPMEVAASVAQVLGSMRGDVARAEEEADAAKLEAKQEMDRALDEADKRCREMDAEMGRLRARAELAEHGLAEHGLAAATKQIADQRRSLDVLARAVLSEVGDDACEVLARSILGVEERPRKSAKRRVARAK